MLGEHKLVSSAMCKIFFFPGSLFWKKMRPLAFIISLVLKHLKTLEENILFFNILMLLFWSISLNTNILVLFYKIEALNYFKNNAQYLKREGKNSITAGQVALIYRQVMNYRYYIFYSPCHPDSLCVSDVWQCWYSVSSFFQELQLDKLILLKMTAWMQPDQRSWTKMLRRKDIMSFLKIEI